MQVDAVTGWAGGEAGNLSAMTGCSLLTALYSGQRLLPS